MCLSIPGRVLAIQDAERCLAVVECDAGRQVVNLFWLVDETAPLDGWVGSWVTFHTGFAMEKIDAATAQTLSALLSGLP